MPQIEKIDLVVAYVSCHDLKKNTKWNLVIKCRLLGLYYNILNLYNNGDF